MTFHDTKMLDSIFFLLSKRLDIIDNKWIIESSSDGNSLLL